jgi:hypothetical protein
MRYLVKGRVKSGCEQRLLEAIETKSLGKEYAFDPGYLRSMQQARVGQDGIVHWIEVCYCDTPLQNERSFWEQYFELVSIKDALDRNNCRDVIGTTDHTPCAKCDCTKRLEERLQKRGESLLASLKSAAVPARNG